MSGHWVFDGHIAGVGTASGLRAVIGLWQRSPFGAFADVMVQEASGHRLLLAPTPLTAEFISSTYSFDEVKVVDVQAHCGQKSLTVRAGPLRIDAATGPRALLGTALKAVPGGLAVSTRWLRAISPLAALAVPGARTFGSAGSGRTEFYGVTDLHHIASASVSWNGQDAGALAPIRPAVTFGFSSVPPRPGIARVRTTIVGSADGR